METALSTLSVLPETREQQHRFADMAIEELMNGNHDLVKMWVKISIMADTLNEIKDSLLFKNAVLRDAAMYKEQDVQGCKITVEQRRTFDFSKCNVVAWNEADAIEKNAKESKKAIEAMLKNLSVPVADATTGELINPPSFTVTEYVKIK